MARRPQRGTTRTSSKEHPRRDRVGRGLRPTRSTATAARPCSPTTSRRWWRPAEPERADRLRRAARRHGRVIQTDRRGGVRLHDPATNSTTVLATIPVYTNSEDGGYGPAIDNNFATNKWVYLFYAPPTVKDVKLSDGEIVTQTTPAGVRARTRPPVRDRAGTRTSATSSSRGSSSSRSAARRPTSTWRPSRRSCASRTTAAPAATSPATSTSTRTTTCGS